MQTAQFGRYTRHFIIHLDGIHVFGSDNREHNANLRMDLKSHPHLVDSPETEKCRFLQRPVNCLRYTVLPDGMAPNEVKPCLRKTPVEYLLRLHHGVLNKHWPSFLAENQMAVSIRPHISCYTFKRKN
ncbi:hypothetical protein EGR_11235 [Echinococcus granulosus]|uniref:Uncharacterized protein n=1 Tax=Echinococcus granulosus TaxID=6210 RepID=W6TYV3_ECHGR|nr:hypothetical protein EGR_11235 [Echinococcus granulosus]EUB53908.1 hypothetical protein EGR_11235 [Echinococcus granulosus]